MTFRHTSCRRILQTSLLRNPLSSPMANIVIICVLPLDSTIRRRKVGWSSIDAMAWLA
jgi:hypothetical protein